MEDPRGELRPERARHSQERLPIYQWIGFGFALVPQRAGLEVHFSWLWFWQEFSVSLTWQT